VRILCDQDVPEPLLDPLRHLLRGDHAVEHVNHIRWTGKQDRFVYPDAKRRGYDVILTNDANQLNDADETDAIRRSGLHHVRYSHRHLGTKGLALAMGGILAAMPGVVDEHIRADGQRLVRIAAISPHDRFDVVDPRRDPPEVLAMRTPLRAGPDPAGLSTTSGRGR